MGDFNIDLLSYINHKPTNEFLTAMQSLNYFELISRPTRFPINKAKGRPSLIDHIYCNFQPNCISGILTNPVSDHLPTFLLIPSIKPKIETEKIQFRLFDDVSRQQFSRDLSGVHWEQILTRQSVDENFIVFQNTLNLLYNKHFRIKTKTIHKSGKSSPWISQGILKSVKTKNFLYKQYLLKLIPYRRYSYYSNKLKEIIKIAKRKYYENYFSSFKTNLKKSWEKINSLTNQNKRSPKRKQSPILVNGVVTNDSKLIADDFNAYFSNIASKLDKYLPPPSSDPLSYLFDLHGCDTCNH